MTPADEYHVKLCSWCATPMPMAQADGTFRCSACQLVYHPPRIVMPSDPLAAKYKAARLVAIPSKPATPDLAMARKQIHPREPSDYLPTLSDVVEWLAEINNTIAQS